MKTNSKMIAASLSLMTSVSAVAGMGGLNVQSNLGEPFSGSIVVTGSEAKAVLQSGSVSVAGGNIQGTVVPQSNGNALIRLRSTAAVNEPVLNFVVKAGNQTRQYTAMINPPHYRVSGAVAARPNRTTATRSAPVVANETANNTAPVQAAKTAETLEVAKATEAPRNPRYYRVQAGEGVAEIAARHRPKGMSVQRAVRALVAANPRAFRNGNPNAMYRNVTLYIPTASQWHHYAQSGQKRRHAAPLRHRHAVSAVAAPVAADVATNNSAPTVAQSTAPQAESVAPVPQTPKPVPQPTPEPAVQPEASKPAETAKTVPASEPVVASEPKTEPASAVKASEPVAAVVSAPASAVVASESAPAPEPVKPKPEPAPVVQEEAPVEEETDWMQMGLLGVGAVAIGGLGYYALSRRRKQEEPESADDDEFELDDNTFVAPTASDAAQRVWSSNHEIEEERFSDDDVFFEDTVSNTPAVNKVADSAFDLDSFEPEPEPEKVAVFAEESSSSEEWEWAADTQPAPVAAAVEEDLSFDALMAEMETTPVAPVSAPVEAVAVAPSVPVVEETSDDLAWLDAQLSGGDDVAFAAASEPVATVVENVPAADDFDLDFGKAALAGTGVAGVASAVLSQEDDTPSVDLDFDVAAPAPVVNEVAFETPAVEEDVSLDFSLPEMEDSVLSVPEVTEEALSFDLPATDSVAEEFAIDKEAVPVPQLEDDASLDFLADLDEPVPAVVEPIELAVADDLAFSVDVDEPALSAVADPVIVETTAADELLAWDTAAPVEQQSAGFVSEAVGMTAPLEAKLELAKMYLEIDDAVAARETLRELIAESTGDVHDQASALLEELGG